MEIKIHFLKRHKEQVIKNPSVLPRVLFVLSYFQGKDQDKLKITPKGKTKPSFQLHTFK